MSNKQSYLPSADLLLKQYIRLAQQFTDAATPQVSAQLCCRALLIHELQLLLAVSKRVHYTPAGPDRASRSSMLCFCAEASRKKSP
jgi:hypothetical protein